MTTPTNLSRDDLVELAALDAFGLLDDFDAAQYNRSFHNAPTAVQDEIIQLQADLVVNEAFLADEDPPIDMRQRVLDAVATAVDHDNLKLAPIARIGRDRQALDGAERVMGGQIFWRAAAFVLAGVLLVTLYFGVQRRERDDQIKDLTIALFAQEDFQDLRTKEIAGTLEPMPSGVYDNPNWIRMAGLHRPDADDGVNGAVFVHRETGYTVVVTHGLAKQPHTVTARLDAGGPAEATATMRPRGEDGWCQVGIISRDLVASVTWEVLNEKGEVVLTSV